MATIRKPFKIARRLDIQLTQCIQPAVIRKLAGQDPSRRLSAVLATERPILRLDDYFGKPTPEVLLMSGFELRSPDRKGIPLLLSPNADTVRNIVGSVRDLQVVRGQLVGNLYFARSRRAKDIEAKVRDGHLVNIELVTQPLDGVRLNAGQSWRGVTGPANVVDRWFPMFASFTPAGSDPLTRVRL